MQDLQQWKKGDVVFSKKHTKSLLLVNVGLHHLPTPEETNPNQCQTSNVNNYICPRHTSFNSKGGTRGSLQSVKGREAF